MGGWPAWRVWCVASLNGRERGSGLHSSHSARPGGRVGRQQRPRAACHLRPVRRRAAAGLEEASRSCRRPPGAARRWLIFGQRTSTRIRHGHPQKPGDSGTAPELSLDRQGGARGFVVPSDTRSEQQKRPPEGGRRLCAPGRTRTCGQALRRRLLYPLSYGGRVWWPLSWVPGCGPVRDVAGDKDRAPASLSLLLRLRGSMWRFGEAVLIIAGRYESCTAFGVSRTGCCALVMPGLCPCPSRPFRPMCSVGAQTCSYASEFP